MAQKALNEQKVVYTRFREEDYNFLVSLAEKECWGKYHQAVKLCVKFAKQNKDEFESFIGNLREAYDVLL